MSATTKEQDDILAEEVQTLQHIFGIANVRKTCDTTGRCEVEITVRPSEQDDVYVDYTLCLRIPERYPMEGSVQVQLKGLFHDKMPHVSAQLNALLQKDVVPEYTGCPFLLLATQWLLDQVRALQAQYHKATLESRHASRVIPVACSTESFTPHNELVLPVIRTGVKVTAKRSSFLGHMCHVHSMQDVHAVVRHFRHVCPETRDATHPAIYAARFLHPVNGLIHEELDDDGEDGASGRLLYLLRSMHLVGWMLVVTRWFGGVLLGPSRYQRITEAALSAISLAKEADEKK